MEQRNFILQELRERVERMMKYFPNSTDPQHFHKELYERARAEAAQYAVIFTALN